MVSDLQMLQVDGPKLYQEIRRLKPDAAPFFIFITGEDEAMAGSVGDLRRGSTPVLTFCTARLYRRRTVPEVAHTI